MQYKTHPKVDYQPNFLTQSSFLTVKFNSIKTKLVAYIALFWWSQAIMISYKFIYLSANSVLVEEVLSILETKNYLKYSYVFWSNCSSLTSAKQQQKYCVSRFYEHCAIYFCCYLFYWNKWGKMQDSVLWHNMEWKRSKNQSFEIFCNNHCGLYYAVVFQCTICLWHLLQPSRGVWHSLTGGLAASCATLHCLKPITFANGIKNLPLISQWCAAAWCLVV